ncbi:hypothetical protein RB653_002761 [Dictyostelium firmibasis]|uniref:Uncharacterized protein n=1 Tax=Dictyostelium firmibasis TaxID=79012 RepID=A0AAN7TY56_9MYCE
MSFESLSYNNKFGGGQNKSGPALGVITTTPVPTATIPRYTAPQISGGKGAFLV